MKHLIILFFILLGLWTPGYAKSVKFIQVTDVHLSQDNAKSLEDFVNDINSKYTDLDFVVLIITMSEDLTKAKILIVEDEQHINRLIELVLISGGYYKIRKAYDGLQALEMIKNEKPDLVLLDVMLPELDGFSLCKMIKEDPAMKSIQVIMLTARKMEEDILQGFENGAIDYIANQIFCRTLPTKSKLR